MAEHGAQQRGKGRVLERVLSGELHAAAFTPEGREVCFERNYLWDDEPGLSDIRVEVTVYQPSAYEKGVRLTRSIPRHVS